MPEQTTIEDLLIKIESLETKIGELESKNEKLSKDNEEIRSFNRKLLDRKVDTPVVDNNDEAKAKLEKYLKGE